MRFFILLQKRGIMRKISFVFILKNCHGPAIAKEKDFGSFSIKLFSWLFIIFLLNSISHPTLAQENSLPSGIRADLSLTPHFTSLLDTVQSNDTSLANALPPVTEPKLLPDNMSLGEKILWGKNGLVHKLGIEPPLSPQERMGELRLRRDMLIAHQIGGFTTLALMYTADYFGQQVIDGHRRMGDLHQIFVAATIVSYAATGLLAVLSPPPLIRRNEVGTTTIHKTLAWIHLIGMIVTPIIGSTIRHRRVFNMDRAHFHQISGYITTAVLTAAMLVIVF